MSEGMNFKYYYGNEAEQFTFYRIPKLLVTDPYFKEITTDAKILYGLLLDRMSLSAKNGWLDDKKRVYIYFSTEEIMAALNVGRNKALKTIAELDAENGIGLIERAKQGQGKPAKIYVKNFAKVDSQRFKNQTSGEEETDPEVYNLNFKTFTNKTSRGPQSKLLEVYNSNPNKNNINNTDSSDTESYLILSADGRCEEMRYEDIIRNNLELDILLERNPYEEELLNGIYELILETVMNKGETIVIASNKYPASFVKDKFLKLKSSHIEYVLECFKGNTTKVKNIKKYLLAALFNAPTTISGYYQAEVNHDMPQFALRRAAD